MKIKNLKRRPMYYRAKFALIGGLAGVIASTSAVTFVNGIVTGHFKPMISKEDKVTTSEVTTSIYSKDGKKVVKSFEVGASDEEIVAFKYQRNNVDVYCKADANRLNKEQLNYIKSKLNVSDVNELEALRYYVDKYSINTNYDYENNWDSRIEDYFDANEKYGMIYIVKDNNEDNTCQDFIKNADVKNMAYGYTIIGCTSLAALGMMLIAPSKTLAQAYEISEEKKKSLKK